MKAVFVLSFLFFKFNLGEGSSSSLSFCCSALCQERQRRLDLRLSRKLQQEKKIEDRLKARELGLLAKPSHFGGCRRVSGGFHATSS